MKNISLSNMLVKNNIKINIRYLLCSFNNFIHKRFQHHVGCKLFNEDA